MSRLDALLHPRSVAFIGGVAAELAVEATQVLNFEGEIWGVNPKRQLAGVDAARSVSSVTELSDAPPDAAFVAVDRDVSIDIVRDLAAIGTKVAVGHASGFAEVGTEGVARQKELLEAAGDMPLVGPNCYGTISAISGAALWPDLHGMSRVKSGVAFVSQSGNVAVNLTMVRRLMDVAYVITVGNQADIGLAEAFEAVVADPNVTGVGLYAEAIDDVDRFAAAAVEAHRRGLPMTIVKTGASESSHAIAASHSASIVGDDTAYDALFRKFGVRRVGTVDEFLDVLNVVSVTGSLGGNKVVSLSCSGGEAGMVADRAAMRDLVFPAFEPEHKAAIEESLDHKVTAHNPLDYQTFIWGNEERLTKCFASTLGDVCDAALLVLDFPADGLDYSRWWPTLDAFAAACQSNNTAGVVAATMAENLPLEARSRARELGLAHCADLDNALSAIEAAAQLRPFVHAEPQPLLRPSVSDTTSTLTEYDAKQLLFNVGIPIPPAEIISASAAEIVDISFLPSSPPAPQSIDPAITSDFVNAIERVGFPQVHKAIGMAHKTEQGGVVLGITNLEQAIEVAKELAIRGNDQVLVETQVTDAVAELLVSVRYAPPVGMLLTLGAGGTQVEILDDTISNLLPMTDDDIRSALSQLRVNALLEGFRGQPPGHVDGIVTVVQSLTELLREHPNIAEIEINPLLVTPGAVWAADALIQVAET